MNQTCFRQQDGRYSSVYNPVPRKWIEAGEQLSILKSADIESADFRAAKGLSPEQISVTRNWQSAKFDPEFSVKLRELKNSDEQTSSERSESQFGA